MNKHTPAPWYWAEEDGSQYDDWGSDWKGEPSTGIPATLRGAEGFDILRYQEWDDESDPQPCRIIAVYEADAMLIRAATDLLEACKWAIGTIRGNRYGLTPAEVAEALEMAANGCEGAIAKAEGGAAGK